MNARRFQFSRFTAFFAVFGAFPVQAADLVQLIIKDHRFVPEQVTVHSGERFRIEVINQDQTPAEFESSELHVEKIIVAGGKISVFAGPLKPGTYSFFDDYHPETTRGSIIATAAGAGG